MLYEVITDASIETEPSNVDLTKTSFPTVTKFYSDTPVKHYDDPAYYKRVLGNENA